MTHYPHCQCYDCHKSRERARDALRRVILWASAIFVLIVVCLFVFGCSSTVTPQAVESHQASYDQGAQTSGILTLTPTGAQVTAHAVDRYNELIGIYGREFLPAISRNYGVTPQRDGSFTLTNEALQKFILMNSWHRMGREPKSK